MKGLDDLRQEQLAMQYMKKFKLIFEQASLSLFLQPYEIFISGKNMGIIEFIPDTQSLHSIKKKTRKTLLRFFADNWKN